MKKQGFTLIELIVVMAIISILVLLGVPKYKSYTEEAKVTKLTVETKELEKASQQYYMRNQDWPRLSDDAYSKGEVEQFSEKIYSSTGKVVELEDGNYYDIGYSKLSNYISKPDNPENYIIQNPVGSVYSLYVLNANRPHLENENQPPIIEGVQLKDIPIGSIVYDSSWVWEHRTGNGYTGSGEIKPVEWLVVAKDHVGYPENSVTLLSKELIGLYCFDNSTDRGNNGGSNHWGNSGSTNATAGIRPFLNATFYNIFSGNFKNTLLETTLNIKTWDGVLYTTIDRVFLPSEKELGGTYNSNSDGSDWGYFKSDSSRMITMNGGDKGYLSRSPHGGNSYGVRSVYYAMGGFISQTYASESNGVRPALNLKSDTLLQQQEDGRWLIVYN